MYTDKIKFTEISANDRVWMTQMLMDEQPEACEYTFVNNFVWRKQYRVEAAQYAGCGIIRYCKAGVYRYSFPFGKGDKKAVIAAVKEMCRESGSILSMYPITEKYRSKLIEWFPGEFFIKSDRADFDYIYLSEKLAELKGRKFHGKRNHIARFKDAEDWSYEPITPENLEECRRMHREWISFRENKWDRGVAEETEAIHEAFDYYFEFQLVGGLIRRSGNIVAFCIGEPLNDDIMVVHFEKAYPNMQGAYPMINQQFVINECRQFKYINREEDTGDIGLRKAKLSYYPDVLLKKYTANESHVTFADKNDFVDIKNLWKICFGDEDAYISFYLEERFDEENMMVIRRDNKIVSMASFMPAAVKYEKEWIAVRYVYAVATLPQYRGNGYAAEIISFASEVYGEPLVLQPADDELCKYYRSIGFVDFFDKDFLTIYNTGSKDGEIYLEEIDADEYKEIRDIHFDRNGYLCWDRQAVGYALSENTFCGGKAFKIRTASENINDIILCRTQKDELIIVETTLEGEWLEKAALVLLRENGCSRAVYKNDGGMVLLPENISRDNNCSTEEHLNEFYHLVNSRTSGGYINLTMG
ncbi:MAG: GNAT family N-acetyltransferase [Lachnospiraceae bacterium]|nr:GNAT family N-acetyltransferase [Lachnospiraceae bacterium]